MLDFVISFDGSGELRVLRNVVFEFNVRVMSCHFMEAQPTLTIDVCRMGQTATNFGSNGSSNSVEYFSTNG